jgi:hypothetical protein
VLALPRGMPRRYQPRQPADTVLYRLVSEQLETLLRHAREEYQHGLPCYVEQELRQYLKCSILAHGFARAYCRACGRSLLVAFSCCPEREAIRSLPSWAWTLPAQARDLLRIVSA